MSFAFLPLYTGDYRRDTGHLTPLKHGIYLLLLMHCWDTKGPIPLDEQECAGICNCRSADEIESLRYVLGRYFTQCEDGWYQERMQREIERAENISRARADAGRAGYEARAKQLPGKRHANAKQLPENIQAIVRQVHLPPPPQPQPPPEKRKDYSDAPGFSAFWARYPHYPNRSSKSESRKRWATMALEPITEAVMGALQACLDIPSWTKNGREFVCAAEVWLRKRLWEQDLVSLDDRLIESITSDPRFADMPR